MRYFSATYLSSKRIFSALLLSSLVVGTNWQVQAAGVQSVTVPAHDAMPELTAMVWTPCAQPSGPIKLGSFELTGLKNCPVLGQALPLIVISHGDSGSSIGHHDTAAALADAGFVVAAVLHPGNNFADNSRQSELNIFETRPADISRLINFMTQDWQQATHLNASKVGVFGFSRGGYTALALIGAKPDAAASYQRFCSAWWSFVIGHCRQLDDADVTINPVANPQIKAAVVVDPLNLFGEHSFTAVSVPVQLWSSELGGDGVTLAHSQEIKAALPISPEYHSANGAGHFVFLAPCPAELAAEAEEICVDPTGIDRSVFHREFNTQVVRFFQEKL